MRWHGRVEYPRARPPAATCAPGLGHARIDGIELCRVGPSRAEPTYLILVSGKSTIEEIVAGLESGDDYLTKPVDLCARPRQGQARVGLQQTLSERSYLAGGHGHVRQLRAVADALCKKIRDDQNCSRSRLLSVIPTALQS